MKHTKIILPALLAVVAALALSVPVRAGGRSKPGSSKGPKTTRPVLGSPKAKVKIEVYGDMQCPYTKRLMTRVIPQLVKAYPNKVQVIWRDNPLACGPTIRASTPAA